MPRGSSLGQRAATRSQRLGGRRLEPSAVPWPRADLRGEATRRPAPPPTARSAASRSTTAASARCSRSPPRAGCCGRASPWRARSGASARGARCSAPPRCSSRSCPTYRGCRRRRSRWWRAAARPASRPRSQRPGTLGRRRTRHSSDRLRAQSSDQGRAARCSPPPPNRRCSDRRRPRKRRCRCNRSGKYLRSRGARRRRKMEEEDGERQKMRRWE